MDKLVVYRPFNDIWNTRSLIERVFDETLSAFNDPFFSAASLAPWTAPFWTQWSWPAFPGDNLPLDLYETDKELVAEIPLPGVQPEDIQVEERDGVLTIRAESKAEQERTTGNWRLQERRYGAWQRSVRLPSAVRSEKAKAELKDGVLRVILPKVTAGSPLKRIPVSIPKIKLPSIGRKEKRIRVKA
jgi:HSP20 family protein